MLFYLVSSERYRHNITLEEKQQRKRGYSENIWGKVNTFFYKGLQVQILFL